MSMVNEYLSFKLGREEYGIPIQEVQEIKQLEPWNRIPTAPAHVKGILNLRGQIVSVIDLPHALKMPPFEAGPNSVMIVLQYASGHVGLLVDSVSDVIELAPTDIQPAPQLKGVNPDHLLGLGVHQERMIILLNIPSVLDLKNTAQAA